jgi:hypothetical protein
LELLNQGALALMTLKNVGCCENFQRQAFHAAQSFPTRFMILVWKKEHFEIKVSIEVAGSLSCIIHWLQRYQILISEKKQEKVYFIMVCMQEYTSFSASS